MICKNCGMDIQQPGKFCPRCGTPIQLPPQEPIVQQQPVQQPVQPIVVQPPQQQYVQPVQAARPPVAYQQPMPPQQYAQAGAPIVVVPPKKKRGGLIAGIIGGVAVIAIAAVALISGGAKLPDVSYSYLKEAAEPKISFTSEDVIFPSLYRSTDAVATFVGTSEDAERDVLIQVEIPGFTQPYEQKTKLSRQITKLNIRPPLLTGEIDLSSEKDAQLKLTVTDTASGDLLLQDSRPIRIMSKYDVVWWSPELRDSNTDNILAFLTPESEGVLELKREAVDYLSYITDGAASAFVGYQDYGISTDLSVNTKLQAIALQGAMSDIAKIKYVNTSFSLSDGSQQRVQLPDDVIKSQSGLCIETSLLMASALQSAGMHCMLIFPPGHAQVAVECWPGWGEYFLIETTTLPMPQNMDWYNYVVSYMTQAEWQGYIDGTGEKSLGKCYVLDCDLAEELHIVPLSN